MILIDCQTELAMTVNSIDGPIFTNNTISLAKTTKLLNIPTILTMIRGGSFGGPIFAQLEEIFPDQKPIDCTTMSIWVEVRSVTSKEAEKYGLDPNQGVAITLLDPKGPLKEAGFEVGDIILGIDNQPIEGMESFVELEASLKPKQKISILALDHRSGNTGYIQAVVR